MVCHSPSIGKVFRDTGHFLILLVQTPHDASAPVKEGIEELATVNLAFNRNGRHCGDGKPR